MRLKGTGRGEGAKTSVFPVKRSTPSSFSQLAALCPSLPQNSSGTGALEVFFLSLKRKPEFRRGVLRGRLSDRSERLFLLRLRNAVESSASPGHGADKQRRRDIESRESAFKFLDGWWREREGAAPKFLLPLLITDSWTNCLKRGFCWNRCRPNRHRKFPLHINKHTL